MRLIDADALISAINKSTCNWAEYLWKQVVCDVINNQPTAFDTEKVVEKLETLHDLVKINQKLAVSQAIYIVKKGGVE